jgi:hypothetical protein
MQRAPLRRGGALQPRVLARVSRQGLENVAWALGLFAFLFCVLVVQFGTRLSQSGIAFHLSPSLASLSLHSTQPPSHLSHEYYFIFLLREKERVGDPALRGGRDADREQHDAAGADVRLLGGGGGHRRVPVLAVRRRARGAHRLHIAVPRAHMTQNGLHTERFAHRTVYTQNGLHTCREGKGTFCGGWVIVQESVYIACVHSQ